MYLHILDMGFLADKNDETFQIGQLDIFKDKENQL